MEMAAGNVIKKPYYLISFNSLFSFNTLFTFLLSAFLLLKTALARMSSADAPN